MTDGLDRQIVAALRRDGRADAGSIAEGLDAVATTVQKRKRALEERGVIEGYTVRLNYDRLGYETAVLKIDTDLGTVDDVTTRLRETASIVTVYETSGGFNVFATGRFENEAAIGTLLQKLHADPDVGDVDVQRVKTVG